MLGLGGVLMHLEHHLALNKAKTISRGIAQLAERRSPKPKVVGSIPTAPAK